MKKPYRIALVFLVGGLAALAVLAAGLLLDKPLFWSLAALLSAFGLGSLAMAGISTAGPLGRLEAAIQAGGTEGEGFDRELEELGLRGDSIGRVALILLRVRKEHRASLERQRCSCLGLECVVRERTEELRALNRDLAVYQRILAEASEGVIVTDLRGAILECNAAFCRLSGYSREELLGRNPRIMKSNRHGEEFYREMWRSILETGRWEGEIWDRAKDGTLYPKWLGIDTIRDEEGRPERYVGISADISKLKAAEEDLNRMAFYDSLTGLPNRALFKDRISQTLFRAQRSGSRAALLYLDLDRFKDVNDSLGHAAGDELLREAASRVAAQVRDCDAVCRLGGDEFTVLLESVARSEDAALVARKIIRALREPFFLADSEVYVGASVGIALYPFDGTSPGELIKRADAAMYEAKEQGRSQFRFASGEAGSGSRRRIETEAGLVRALERGEFLLHFQPQVATGRAVAGSSAGLVGAEALVRWQVPGRHLVQPSSFIDVAEETGIVVPLGAWVLRAACGEAKAWADAGRPLVVSVNVSQRQFERGRIVEQVLAALDETGLPPRLLKLEVTESLFMRDLTRAAESMAEIKRLGVSFAVDDFGVGYSSLRYIDRLPIDCLKIDKAFIDRITSRRDGGEIATAVVSLARSFGLSSIAEGVETPEQLEALRARGCDEVQGFLVSKPLGAAEFRDFIGSGASPAGGGAAPAFPAPAFPAAAGAPKAAAAATAAKAQAEGSRRKKRRSSS